MTAITLGGAGALLATRDHRVRLAAPSVRVVDTIGAGDTFMTSLICSLLEDPSPPTATALERAGTRAVNAAAITVSRAGADLPWVRELSAR